MTYKLNDFEVLELIGSGSFGSCYKVRHKQTREVLVWKVIEYGCLSEEKKQLLVTEVSLLRDLRHPHIVRYYDRIVCKETKQLYILIEYCPGGDLATVIRTCIRSNTHVEEGFVWRVLYQLINALQTCHSWVSSTVILHRDIKPANVFLDNKGNVKLGDFGLACKLDADQPGCSETMVGTPFYMSPEVMKGEMYNSKSDVWSLGCLVYELCALKPPFHAQNIKELSLKVTYGRFDRIPAQYSDNLQRVLTSLLLVSQEQRPSIFDLICHPLIPSNLPVEQDYVSNFSKRPPAPPPSSVDGEPEKISRDTFQTEWLSRLQNLREREAALRNRELQLEEREHLLNRREHRLALMDRAVKDKMVLAEVYLRRARENCSGQGGQSRQCRSLEWQDIDESFSADAGDTSMMPTSALLDPLQVPKPSQFLSKPEKFAFGQDRHVHFDNHVVLDDTPPPTLGPVNIAEAIRHNKGRSAADSKPRMLQKVLHFPGYTGPAITVDVPVSENVDLSAGKDSSSTDKQNANSPSVKFTVLYDDREELQKATERLDALNLESKSAVSCCSQQDLFRNIVPPLNRKLLGQSTLVGSVQEIKNAAASVDSLLNPSSAYNSPNLTQQYSFPSEIALRKNAFGGSTRRRKSSSRSSASLSTETKSSCENFRENLENAKNNALLLYQKENQARSVCVDSKRRSFMSEKGKENVPGQHGSSVPKRSVAASLMAIPSAAAAAASAVVSRSKKSNVSFLR